MKKLKANTLPEVMIALTITSFCATLAVVIYLNIQKSTMPFIKIKAAELADKYMMETLQNKDVFDKEYAEEEYRIVKTIRRNEKYPDCKDLIIAVFDVSHKKLAQLQTTIHDE